MSLRTPLSTCNLTDWARGVHNMRWNSCMVRRPKRNIGYITPTPHSTLYYPLLHWAQGINICGFGGTGCSSCLELSWPPAPTNIDMCWYTLHIKPTKLMGCLSGLENQHLRICQHVLQFALGVQHRHKAHPTAHQTYIFANLQWNFSSHGAIHEQWDMLGLIVMTLPYSSNPTKTVNLYGFNGIRWSLRLEHHTKETVTRLQAWTMVRIWWYTLQFVKWHIKNTTLFS